MVSRVHSILSQVNKDRPLNILTVICHERYESGLCQTGHNFYALYQQGLKTWTTDFAEIPSNYHILRESSGVQDALSSIPDYVNIDLVLSHHRFGSYQLLAPIAEFLRVPLISLEHTLPLRFDINDRTMGWDNHSFNHLRSMKGNENVFISDFSRDGWLFDRDESHVIEHGVDTELFKTTDVIREDKCLSVVNDWINRDVFCGYKIWKEVIKGFPYKVLGTTPGLSQPAQGIQDLANHYAKHSIFVNTSQISPIPSSLLEAASSGAAIVSASTCMIPEVFTNGVDAFLSNNVETLRKHIRTLLNEPEMAREMGLKARQTILDRFSMERFINDWNYLFERNTR
jgi:glycosyltransferase involved in cell wall biosynthesis